jgi:hypothetical protein
MMWKHCLRPSFCLVLSLGMSAAWAELRVPASTAYLDPNVEGARVSERGISRWRDPSLKIVWFGEIKTAAPLSCSVVVRLAEGQQARYRLTVAGQSREASATGLAEGPVTAAFGSFEVRSIGYQRFMLEALNGRGEPLGDVEALILEGPAVEGAHFNLKSRRNAASVHLRYPVPAGVKVQAFYCEVTGIEDPLWTYYMACGWHRGYFGMQVNGPAERRIIFSVWDSGKEGVDRKKVADEDRVALVAKGEGVVAEDFGNEGTGGHSHVVIPWKTGQVQRFLVTAKPVDADHTIYAGYYFSPDQGRWLLISSWRAPKEGGYLRDLYSFSEDFSGSNGHLLRKALYGNQWIRTPEGRWIELVAATFSHDPTGKADRLDRFMGLENGQFFLSHGGFVPGTTVYGQRFERPAMGRCPGDIVERDRP